MQFLTPTATATNKHNLTPGQTNIKPHNKVQCTTLSIYSLKHHVPFSTISKPAKRQEKYRLKRQSKHENQPQQTSLAVQWLRFCTFTTEGMSSVPDQGTKIPHATQCSQKTKQNLKPEIQPQIQQRFWNYQIWNLK